MATFDDAVDGFVNSLDNSTEEFLNDVEEMENEGLSTLEILALLAGIDLATYFIEDLGASAGISSYMVATENVLSDMPFFGGATEEQLLALQSLQRSTITNYTGHVGTIVRDEISKGVVGGQTRDQIKEAITRRVGTNKASVSLIIETGLADYQQSVSHIMSADQPATMKYFYIGPMDERTRPLCREILAGMPYTKAEIDARFPGAFIDRGGPRCRHHWGKMSPDKVLVRHRNEARRRIKELKDAKRYKKPITIQEYYGNRKDT